VLFLLFQLGPDRYAIDTRRIAEVLPLVTLKQLPHAPAGVAGVFNYRGAPVPVVDLSAIALGRPSEPRLNTRILLVQCPNTNGGGCLLGVIVEHATEVVRRDVTDFVASGVANARAPYLGPVASDARGLTQWIDVETLLPMSVRRALFEAPATVN